jgi:hypothetical protein
MTRAAWGLYWAYWVFPENFPTWQGIDNGTEQPRMGPDVAQMWDEWSASCEEWDRIADAGHDHNEVHRIGDTTLVPTAKWPGSAPIPNYTPWYGLCVTSVMEPMPGMAWYGTEAVLAMGTTSKRGDARRKNKLHGTKRIQLQDLRHHSPYALHWPGDTETYLLEKRTPWGPYPLTMPEATVRLRPRPAQRKLGGYGGRLPGHVTYAPPDWDDEAEVIMTTPSGNNALDLDWLNDIMFHPIGDKCLPQLRNPLDLNDKLLYKLFDDPDHDYDRALYKGRGGHLWNTCARYG